MPPRDFAGRDHGTRSGARLAACELAGGVRLMPYSRRKFEGWGPGPGNPRPDEVTDRITAALAITVDYLKLHRDSG